MAKIPISLVRGYNGRVDTSALQLASQVLRELGSEYSSSMLSCIEGGRWDDVFEARIEPGSYRSSSEFSVDYLAANILRKYPHKGYMSAADRARTALEKFKDSEESCRRTNERLSKSSSVPVLPGVTASALIHRASVKIAKLLGDFSWDEAEQNFGLGPGATFKLPRSRGDHYYKFGCIPEVTPSCAVPAICAIARVPRWYECISAKITGPVGPSDLPWVPGNRITTVPKNAKTDRVIAIEPLMNMYVQKGIGGVIRKRLRRVGVNLNDQRPNQVFAKLGSIDGSLATIDLSSASDSVSLKLCELLLPPDWFSVIEQTRSPYGSLPDGTIIKYQKVSSMGNGFTFELESLLFWAIARAVGEFVNTDGDHRLRVYGDDIIVPTALAGPLIQALSFFGFETNKEKTFVDGPFRESCGKHYFSGVDVSPFYVDDDIDSVQKVFWFHNQLVFWLRRQDPSRFPVVDRKWEKVLDTVRRSVPSVVRKFRIPYGDPDLGTFSGDIGFISSFDKARPKLEHHFGVYRFTGITTSGACFSPSDTPFLLRQLFSLYKRGQLETGEGAPGRIVRKQRVSLVKGTTFRWEDPFTFV